LERTRARILQASTSEVYRDPAVNPQTEDYLGHVNAIGPRVVLRRGQALRLMNNEEGFVGPVNLGSDGHRQQHSKPALDRP